MLGAFLLICTTSLDVDSQNAVRPNLGEINHLPFTHAPLKFIPAQTREEDIVLKVLSYPVKAREFFRPSATKAIIHGDLIPPAVDEQNNRVSVKKKSVGIAQCRAKEKGGEGRKRAYFCS